MPLQFLSNTPFLFQNLNFLLFYIVIQTASPFSSVLSALKAPLCLAVFPQANLWLKGMAAVVLLAVTHSPLLWLRLEQLQHALVSVRRQRGPRVSWAGTAGGKGEWKQVAEQTPWESRTECLPAIPQWQQQWSWSCENDWVISLGMKQTQKRHGAIALFTIFIRLPMEPISAGWNKLQARSITEDNISPRCLTREHFVIMNRENTDRSCWAIMYTCREGKGQESSNNITTIDCNLKKKHNVYQRQSYKCLEKQTILGKCYLWVSIQIKHLELVQFSGIWLQAVPLPEGRLPYDKKEPLNIGV